MAWLWQQLAGDTARFAIRLAFAADPHQGRAAAPDLAASWGSFELWVDGLNLCAHVEEGERIEAVHWYLLPLIEWFAAFWNPLLQEERLPIRNAGSSAWRSMRDTRFPPAAPADVESRANAFAAMLLMPPASVRDAISELAEPIDTVAGVRAVASRLQTSFNATAWHLVNLGFLDEDVRARIAAAH